MTPLNRKENYLNEIVGWGNTAPEKPTTPEEFFFAAILGEAVQVPDLSNASRYELFLAKIAGYNVNVSPPTYTSPRLEFFLAKAAGMDVVTPVPLTKEEIFWANYKGIEQIIEGIPPLTFTAKAGTLSNYRIYGNTVNGESVGDRTGNLFDENSLISPISGFTWYFDDEHYLLATNTSADNRAWRYSQSQFFIALSAGTYTLQLSGVGANSNYSEIRVFKSNGDVIHSENIADKKNIVITFTLNTAETIGIEIKLYNGKYRFMLGEGSTPLPYEPYGYKVPVTVSNGTDTETTNIYLDEQLTKSGDNADYIDYATQKRYNADGTTVDVELPTLQTVEGTNTLSVRTEVQPSKVYIKGEKEREYT